MAAGRCSVVAFSDVDGLVGVLVLALVRIEAGRCLSIEAARFRPGRWSDLIDSTCTAVAESCDCRAIRYDSARPVHRLFPGFVPVSSRWIRWLDHGQQQQQ